MDFVAVDVETANWDKSSICQIGWSLVNDGQIVQNESLLIDPQTYFDPFNKSIHGITESDVEGAPTFADVRHAFHEMMNSVPVISYGLFDQAAFDLADDDDANTSFVTEMPWVNGQRIVRRAWPEHFKQKYNLGLVADTLGLKLQAHDAGSDAQVLAQAILLAAEKLEMDFEQMLQRAYQPLSQQRNYRQQLQMIGEEGGPLSGEMICFTGSLSVVRTQAAEMVNGLGAGVCPSVTKKTTILVVGTQESPMVLNNKSNKHCKAEGLKEKGFGIEILSEDQFWAILERSGVGHCG